MYHLTDHPQSDITSLAKICFRNMTFHLIEAKTASLFVGYQCSLQESAEALDLVVKALITNIHCKMSLCLYLLQYTCLTWVWNWESMVHKLKARSLTNYPIASSLKEKWGRSKTVSNHIDGSNSIDWSQWDCWFAFE